MSRLRKPKILTHDLIRICLKRIWTSLKRRTKKEPPSSRTTLSLLTISVTQVVASEMDLTASPV